MIQKGIIPWYKRNYVIDPNVQLKIVGLLASIAVIASTTICVVAYERLLKLGVLFNGSALVPAMVPQAFRVIAISLMLRLIAIMILMIATFGVAGVFLTHRIAGPIWKLQQQLERFLNGEKIPPVYFRQTDEFKKLPGLINRLMEGYDPHRGSKSTKDEKASS